MKRFFRRTGVGVFGLALVSSYLGCSPPPPPPKVIPKPQVVVAPPPPPPPLPPAKWMQVAGATVMGPQVDGGRLMLVGGRRVLLASDGSTKAETAPSPEPLQQLIVVPMPGGTKRIIARGNNGIYKLDDPLGAPKALAQSELDISAIAPYAGLIVLWTYNSDAPRFIDADTGKFKLVPTLPPLPMRSVVFLNEKEGAAVFEAVGLAVTADGGTTWKRVTEEVNGDAFRILRIFVRDGALRGSVFEDGMESPIDVAQARVGRAVDPPAESNPSSLVRWVRTTGTDPIAAAAQSGIEVGEGAALVASNGLLARVDLKSGTITALEEFAHEVNSAPCTFQRAGNSGWLACPVSEQPNADLYEPFGVMRVSLDGTNLKPERPAFVRSGETELRASPSGGVMIMGQCTQESDGEVCVRQPDGRWVALSGGDIELSSRAVGPLSDGRVAFLRNMWDGDKPEAQNNRDEPEEETRNEAEESEESPEDREDRVVPENKRLYIAALGDGRKEERIATIAWRSRTGDIRVQSPIQEDADHNLHLIIADEEGVYSVVQPMDKEARAPQRLEGMSEARLRGSRGIAVGMDGIRATTDGGRTWTGVPMPTRARDALMQIDSIATDPASFGVSEVGMLLDKTVRIGWGSTDNIEEPIEPVFDSTLPAISRVAGPEKLLTCTVETNVQGTPPIAGSAMLGALLGKKQPAPKGTRRAASTAMSSRDGVMGTMANFDEEGPDKPGALPAKWTFSWFDPSELGGKPHTWSGATPKNSPWGAQLRNVFGVGARALFVLRIGNKNVLVRTKGGGIETAEVGADLLPSNDAVFGSDKGEPIAWTRDNSLVVWISGEAPRVIGQVSYRSTRVLGEPTKDGVPVLMSAQDWSAIRTFPIPALDKKASAPPAPLAPTLEGWTAAPNLPMHIGRFGVCTAKPKGAVHILLSRSYARASIDTALGSLGGLRYDVYLSGADACVAQVAATYNPDRSSSRTPPATTNAPKKAPITFVRADFLAKRAEGGTRGLPAKDAMHKLTCTLEERK